MYLLDALPAQIRSVSVRKSTSGNPLNKIFNVSVNACSHFHSLSTTSTSLISVTSSLIHTQRSFIGQHQHSVFYIQILVFFNGVFTHCDKAGEIWMSGWVTHGERAQRPHDQTLISSPSPTFSLCFLVIVWVLLFFWKTLASAPTKWNQALASCSGLGRPYVCAHRVDPLRETFGNRIFYFIFSLSYKKQ